MAEHSPARILQVRAKLYDLLSHCIPASTVLKVSLPVVIRLLSDVQTLTFKLIPLVDDALKPDVIKWSAFYEHRIRIGSVSNPSILSYSAHVSTEAYFPSRSLCCKVYEDIRGVSKGWAMNMSI